MPRPIVLLVCTVFSLVQPSPEEYRLIQDLRQNYDAIERPVANHSEPVHVKMRIILQQIVDVDEKNQVLTLVVWQQTKWYDYKMRWDPSEYGGIKMVQLPNNFLWKPDILLFNSADSTFDASFAVNFVVQHTGEILLAPPGIVKLSCAIDITWFPYDEQICHLKYGSWTYNGNQLDLHVDDEGIEGGHHIDLQYFMPNGEWELLATPAERVATEFVGLKYVEVYFRMHMKRRTLYYGLNWIVPSMLITLTNVLGYTLPPECGEKITLQITNLLSVTVFLGMVSEITPPTSESIPVIALFFSISMLLLGWSIIVTILIVSIFFRSPQNTREMNPTMRLIFLEWLPWLLLMTRPGTTYTKPSKSTTVVSVPIETKRLLREESASRLAQHDSYGRRFPLIIIKEGPLSREQINWLLYDQEKLDDDDRLSDAQADWRFMALVLDRISLYLFTALFIVTMFFLALFTPRMFDFSPHSALLNTTDSP
ncbi:hypothetical protein PMAYCL1PPCAC_07970 [Pristionchus mayeri]|uniref:Uncharacterized protein n=1 Tax=Pristionchus mayeri TaxID=1317129 RepID=A0AAN5CB99_9BILA|nr:hypothetical protein PMAYCL1PPCAC_07970 [Pristionchus mayeri]